MYLWQQVSGTPFMDNCFYGCRHSCGISWLSVYTVPFWKGERGTSDLQILDTKNCTAVVPADKWIREMSDEELEELVSFSESDIFLN